MYVKYTFSAAFYISHVYKKKLEKKINVKGVATFVDDKYIFISSLLDEANASMFGFLRANGRKIL